MKKHILPCLFGIIFLISVMAMPLSVSADMGPKPSVVIRFRNLGDEVCYATLLSKRPSTGPQSVWDGDEAHIYNYDLDIEIWRAFAEYEDSDGFYFLQTAAEVQDSKEYAWTYYPPEVFKILLYFPESGVFSVSGICERYAFDSYYTADMAGLTIADASYDAEASGDHRLTAYRAEEYLNGIVPLGARILMTIALEILVALFFGLRGKQAYLLLAGVNVATQLLLNALLFGTFIWFRLSYAGFILIYLFLELLIFIAEGFVYTKLMPRFDTLTHTSRRYVIYALTANALSFLCGVVLAPWMAFLF